VKHEFGWLPLAKTFRGDGFHIEPLTDFGDVVASIRESAFVERDWFYPPLIEGSTVRASEVFQLPTTHVLESDLSDDEVHFIITVLGFIYGLRLIPEEWVHFYRARITPHTRVGFYIQDDAILRILSEARATWASANRSVRKKLFGALHWHMFSRSYEHTFEVFNAQYTVLDTCWRIYAEQKNIAKDPRHPERVVMLAQHYQVPLPPWAAIDDGKTSFLSRLRNELAHEGLFAGEPIAFAHPREHEAIHRELFSFNTRLLLALLGEDSWFVHSKLSRSMAMIK
jgi:hypothetical protein